MSNKRKMTGTGTPLGLVLLGAVAVITAAVVIYFASPGTWNWIWDKDHRKIRPPQYLVQIPSSMIRLGNAYQIYWNDNRKSKDYSLYWRMIESDESVISGVDRLGYGQATGDNTWRNKVPTKNKRGPFWTTRDLRKAMIDLGVKQVTLYGSNEIVRAK